MSKLCFDKPTVLVIEHGDTEFSEGQERIHGVKYDLPLTAKGRKQIRSAADTLRNVDIVSIEHSPQKRSTESAAIIGRAVGVVPKKDMRLKPIDAGYLSGMTHDAAKERLLYYIMHPKRQIPDGQPGGYAEWYKPWSEKLAETLARAKDDSGGAHLLVLHSSEILSVPHAIRGELPDAPSDWSPGGGQISVIEHDGRRWRFYEDFASWLEDKGETVPNLAKGESK